MDPTLDIVFRTVVVYLMIVVGIRIFGKREISQLSIIDLVFILLISNAVQNAMVGPSASLESGLIAALTLFALNYIFRLLTHSKKLAKIIEGQPLMLIYKGKILRKHLAQSGITNEELMQAVREHGVEKISEVNMAVLEVDGNISIMSDKFRKKTVRKRKVHKVLSSFT